MHSGHFLFRLAFFRLFFYLPRVTRSRERNSRGDQRPGKRESVTTGNRIQSFPRVSQVTAFLSYIQPVAVPLCERHVITPNYDGSTVWFSPRHFFRVYVCYSAIFYTFDTSHTNEFSCIKFWFYFQLFKFEGRNWHRNLTIWINESIIKINLQ